MHPEIDKMVKLAQGRGALSVAQRDMIINKARQLGDDPVEVEFLLSDLVTTDNPANTSSQFTQPVQGGQNAAVETAPAKKSKKKIIWTIVIVVVVLLAAYFTWAIVNEVRVSRRIAQQYENAQNAANAPATQTNPTVNYFL